MIGLIISTIGMFAWLLYETDWLRVNLMPQPIDTAKSKPITWNEKTYLCLKYNLRDYIGVLPGWEWARDHESLVPVYTIEFRIDGTKQTITNASPKVLAEVMKIYRTKHKPKKGVMK